VSGPGVTFRDVKVTMAMAWRHFCVEIGASYRGAAVDSESASTSPDDTAGPEAGMHSGLI
jgi:hypothetical protein